MAITEKAKEKLDEASKEIKTAIDGLAEEVAGLSERVKEKLKGSGKEMKEVTEALSKEVSELSEKVKQLIPKRRQKHRFPVRRVKQEGQYPKAIDFPLAEFRREFNRLWHDFTSSSDFPSNIHRRRYPFTALEIDPMTWPQMDITESGDKIWIAAELPGVDKEDIDISVDPSRVILRGEKKAESEKKDHGFYQSERYYGAFHRSIPLPCDVDAERVEAQFKNGVLTIVLPKSASALERVRKIPVLKE